MTSDTGLEGFEPFDPKTDRLIGLPGVVGIGEGEQAGTPAVIVMVSKLTPELKAALPAELEGHPVIVEVTGEITAFGVE